MTRSHEQPHCSERHYFPYEVHAHWKRDVTMSIEVVAAHFGRSEKQIREALHYIEGLSFETLDEYVKCPAHERMTRYGFIIGIPTNA